METHLNKLAAINRITQSNSFVPSPLEAIEAFAIASTWDGPPGPKVAAAS